MKNFNFVLDVDGVLTSGKFLYSSEGKIYKEFGPHDAYSLKKLNRLIHIEFISADKRGFSISEKRVNDMGFNITLVSEDDRFEFSNSNFEYDKLFYMGDGDSDANIIDKALCGIAPSNARPQALSAADYVTSRIGGEGAVAEACDYIKLNFFNNSN